MDKNGEIQVTGLDIWRGSDWRVALQAYLQAIFSGSISVLGREQLRFSEKDSFGHWQILKAGVKHWSKDQSYYAEGATCDVPPIGTFFLEEEILTIGGQRIEADWGVARFVNDDRLKCLVIRLGSERCLFLWKKDNDELGVAINYGENL